MSGATALWLAALVAGMLSATGAMGGADAPSRWPQSMAQAAAKGLSASVTVYGMARDGRSYCDVRAADDEKPLQDEAGPPDPLEAPVRVGSGFIVDGEGHVVTAAHVVAGCDHIVVKLSDGRVAEARRVGEEPRADIALLKIPLVSPAPAFGRSSTLRPGDWVLGVGNPFGLSRSVSAGIVGATDLLLDSDGDTLFIQSDVSLSPGNSGGPLLDLSGAIVGMNARMLVGRDGGAGVSFSVPIEVVLSVVEDLTHGRAAGPSLGAQFADLPPPLALARGRPDARGALMLRVPDSSLAHRIGLRTGDVVLGMNGRSVASGADLARAWMAWRHSEGTLLTVMRDSRIVQLSFERPGDGR